MLKLTGAINFLVVVFLNAFTDLGHKIIIQNTVFKVYDGSMQIVLTAIVNGLILLPFILVFSPAGYLSDRFAKNKIMKYSALFAIIITLGITYAYYHGYFILAFVLTFILALQSAIYGPAKYGYIKELFGIKYISEGNGAIQAVTTVAILGGIIFYSVLFEGRYTADLKEKSEILQAIAPIGWLLVGGSVIEYILASKLPQKVYDFSKKEFKFEKYKKGIYLHRNLKTLTRKKEIYDAVIALGLFWSISQVVLAIFGEWAKEHLGITNTIIVQGVMALSGIGIVIGSLLAAKFSKQYINMGLASFGAIGLSLIVFLIPFTGSISVIAVMFVLLGVLSGFVLVPLNAKIQYLSPKIHLGTILAANNFIQNIFMFVFLALTTFFAYFSVDAVMLFYMMAFVGLILSVILFRRYYKDLFWATVSLLLSLRYKFIYVGLENIPKEGAVLLLGNHVSWCDWAVLQMPLQRNINYMMDKDIYYNKFFHFILKAGEVIPLSPRAFKDAFKEAYKRLKMGRVVAIFPEGGITRVRELGNFKRGYELIPKDYDGVIIPFFIDGLFGSVFAKYKPTNSTFSLKRREVYLYFGEALDKHTTASELRDVVLDMKEKYERI